MIVVDIKPCKYRKSLNIISILPYYLNFHCFEYFQIITIMTKALKINHINLIIKNLKIRLSVL